jgi:hypothetical protein
VSEEEEAVEDVCYLIRMRIVLLRQNSLSHTHTLEEAVEEESI